jgi:hypothetical protein
MGDFGETWYKDLNVEVCILCREPWRIIFKEVIAHGFCIFFEKYCLCKSSSPFGDFNETWYKGRSHFVNVHVTYIKGALSNYFSRSYGPWT